MAGEEALGLSNWHAQRHVHAYEGTTSFDKGHAHGYLGATGPAEGHGEAHYHPLVGLTTHVMGHHHRYRGITGPAVMEPRGTHTHEIQLETSFDEEHSHSISGRVQAVREEEG